MKHPTSHIKEDVHNLVCRYIGQFSGDFSGYFMKHPLKSHFCGLFQNYVYWYTGQLMRVLHEISPTKTYSTYFKEGHTGTERENPANTRSGMYFLHPVKKYACQTESFSQ